MLTCIARSKQPSNDSSPIHLPEKPNADAPPPKQTINKIKDMALKASGAYRHCAPCVSQPAAAHQRKESGGETGSVAAAADKFRWSYRRTGSSSSNSSSTAGRKELQARLKGITSGEGTPASASGRRVDSFVFVEEREPKEWVAQVEPGVLITFVSLPRGGNDLKKIKFSREMFDKWQAQRWWADNCEKVTELYNVQKLNRQAFPLPNSTPRSEDDATATTKMESVEAASPVTPPPPTGMGIGNSSSESFDHASTPKLSSMSGTKMETSSSLDASMSTTSSSQDVDRSGDMLISNSSNLETEWVVEDESGVYLTIRALPDGGRELRRVRFSREQFGEMHARLWWEENRERILKQYL